MHIWKERTVWISVVALILLVSVSAYDFGGKGYPELSFAGSIVSIILAVVAIFYSFIQGSDSQRNMEGMQNLVSEASRLISVKSDEMTTSAKSMTDALDALRITQPSDDLQKKEPDCVSAQGGIDVRLLTDIELVTLYAMVKSGEYRKPVNYVELGSRLTPLGVRLALKGGFFGIYCLAVPSMCRAFWGKDIFRGNGEYTATTDRLPDGVAECVMAEVNVRRERADFRDFIEKTDEYLQGGK